MPLKAGYKLFGCELQPHENCDGIRSMAGISKCDDGDLLDDELSDVALAAIVRFTIVSEMLYSPDPAMSCLAAGIVGTSRSLHYTRYWSGMGFQCEDPDCVSWPSSVVKIAGAHLSDTPRSASRHWRSAEDLVYTWVGGCVTRALASTVSDDAGLDRESIMDLKRGGVLITPNAKAWGKAVQAMHLLVGNRYLGTPECRLSFKYANGKKTTRPLAPARTMALLSYACSILPEMAGRILTDRWGAVRMHYRQFAAERARFAMWVCGHSAEPATQLKCFDLMVADLFDRMPYINDVATMDGSRATAMQWLYGGFRSSWCIAEQAGVDEVPVICGEGGYVKMMLPPWASSGGPKCPNVMPKPCGVFAR